MVKIIMTYRRNEYMYNNTINRPADWSSVRQLDERLSCLSPPIRTWEKNLSFRALCPPGAHEA